MKCTNCGTENSNGAKFCERCGAPMQSQVPPSQQVPPAQQMPQRQMNTQPQSQPQQSQTPPIPAKYKPISMWGYFGYELLFAIPLVGFILLLVFSFGGTQNVNLKNFARSYFCLAIIAVVLFVILYLIFGVALPASMRY